MSRPITIAAFNRLREAYLRTDLPVSAIAAMVGINHHHINTLARKNGWPPRNKNLSASLVLMNARRKEAATS